MRMSLNNIVAFAKEKYKRFMETKPTVPNKDKIRYIEVVFKKPDGQFVFDWHYILVNICLYYSCL